MIRFNIITCMKVTGEIFSFIQKRKGVEEVRYQKYLNFQLKGLLPNKDSGIVKRGHSSFRSPHFIPGKK